MRKLDKNEPKPRKGTFPFLAFMLFLGAIIFSISTELEEIFILSQSQNPISFIGIVILFSIITTFLSGYAHWKPKKDDGSVQTLFFATSLLLIVVIVKSIFDNYWNTFNLAYLFIPLSLITGTLVTFNLSVLKKVILPAAYALLAWPFILVKGHAALSEPLIDLTTFFVTRLSKLFNVPLVQIDPQNHVFEVTSTGFQAYIGSACSGTSSLFAVIILSLPLLFFLKDSRIKKGLWIALGAMLAILGNIVRTFLIFFFAHTSGTDLALTVFHNTGGMVIFALIFILQMVTLAFFKLRLHLPKAQPIDNKTSLKLTKRTLLFVSFMIVLAFISIQTAYPEPAPTEIQKINKNQNTNISTDTEKNEVQEEAKAKSFILEDIPQQPTKEFDYQDLNDETSRKFLITKNEPYSYIPPLGGYNLTFNSLDFAKSLFGPNAEYHRFRYKQDQDPTMFTDVIVTDDPNSLLGLSSGYCYRYHNYNILYEEKVQIKEDIIGNFYSYTDNRDINWESLDFITPVIDQNSGKIYYRKIRIIREVRLDLGEDFNTTRETVELFGFQLFDSLFFAR